MYFEELELIYVVLTSLFIIYWTLQDLFKMFDLGQLQ